MNFTRSDIEVLLTRRTGKLLTAAGLDGVTVDGTNADLNDPIAWAVRQCDGSVATATAVTDADVSTVATEDADKLLDLAELRTLETIVGNLDTVDLTVGPRSERLSQLATQVSAAIDRKRASVQRAYGVGSYGLQGGAITLSFTETGRTTLDE